MPDNAQLDTAKTPPLDKRDLLVMCALAVAALLIFAFLFSHKYEGLRSNDQFDYSHLARNLYRGDGFTTKALKPLELGIDPRIKDHPDYWRPPLYVLMICIAYFLVGVKPYAGVLVSGFFFVFIAPMTYLFGTKLSGRVVGVSAALVVMFLPQMWDYSLHALTEMSFAFLLILLVYAIYVGANPFVTGLAFGLCYLHRYNALAYLPAILFFFVVVDKRNWRDIGLFGAGALLLSLPWLIRNTIIAGSPMFSLQKYEIAMLTSTYPGYYLYATFDPVGPIDMLQQHAGDLLDKYMRGLNYLTGEIPRLTHPAVMLLFFGGLLAFRIPRRARLLLYTIFIMIVVQVHLVAIVHPLVRVFVPFIPLVVVFAVIAFEQLLRLAPWQRARPWLMGAAVFVVAATSFFQGRHMVCEAVRAISQDEAEYLDRLRANTTIATDQPWVVAWETELITIWAPVKYDDFAENLPGVDHVFFSHALFAPFGTGGEGIYRREYLDNPRFNREFALEKRFDTGSLLFVRRP
jgi:hypothetical protein